MIRSKTIADSVIKAPPEKPVEKPPDIAAIISSALMEIGRSNDENASLMRKAIEQVSASALMEIGRSNDKNASLMRNAIEQVSAAEAGPITGMTIVHETDPKSIRYGMLKHVVFTRD